jgi:hypothetical protein
MATPASQRRQSNRTRPPAERPSRPEDVGMKTTRRGESRCLSATPKASNGSAECLPSARAGLHEMQALF